MRRLAALSLASASALALACGSGADADDRARDVGPASLRVATWNVHDLFDEVAEEGPGAAAPSHAAVEAKLDAIAAVLARIDADVVILQEVEHAGLVERLADRLSPRPAALLVEGNDPRGIDVAALSRAPVDAYVSHRGERGPDGELLWSRDLVELHVRAAGARAAILGTHLVSKRRGEEARRRRQAERVAAIAAELRARDPGAALIVAGDLNDEPGSAALEPLLMGRRFVDPIAVIATDRAWTWSASGVRERLDYVLLDAESAIRCTHAEVDAGPGVAASSDHRPVWADLWLGAARARDLY